MAAAAARFASLRARLRKNSNAEAVKTILMRNTIAIAIPIIAPVERSDFLASVVSPAFTIVVFEDGDAPAVPDGEFDNVAEFGVYPRVLFAVQS